MMRRASTAIGPALVFFVAVVATGCLRSAASRQCDGESSEHLCASAALECGAATVKDSCGTERAIDCGGCAAGWSCGLWSPNTCGCDPESDEAFCERAGGARRCGDVEAADNCGTSRSASCGACPPPLICGGGGTPGLCGCETQSDLQLCAAFGFECGKALLVDGCGQERALNCGTCTAPMTCAGLGVPGVCGCRPESAAVLCDRARLDCGTVTLVDSCGNPREVDCGSCLPGETCGGTGTPNLCGCTPESDTAICARLGRDCGTLSALDNCNAVRQLDCGACAPGVRCGAGGVPNICGCESDKVFCARRGADCGALGGTDLCGGRRQVECGACASPLSCGGAGEPNVCGCVAAPMTCAALGKNCGEVAAFDACGRLQVLQCGHCSGRELCGAGGIANVCGAPICHEGWCWERPLPAGHIARDLAALAPNDVWAATDSAALVLHFDGTRWEGRAAPAYSFERVAAVSGVVWFAGSDGAETPSPVVARWDHGWHAWSPSAGIVRALYAAGADDVWASGSEGPIVHWNGTSWTSIPGPPMPSWPQSNINALRPFGATELWVGTNAGLYIWNGSSWSTEPAWDAAGWDDAGMAVYRIFATSRQDIWMASNVLAHWDGRGWTTASGGSNPIPELGGITALAGTSASDVWAAGGVQFYTGGLNPYVLEHSDGTRWSSPVAANMRALEVTSPSEGWAASADGALWRLSGAGWQRQTAGAPPGRLTSPQGFSATDLWVVSGHEGLLSRTVDGWEPLGAPTTDPVALWRRTSTDAWLIDCGAAYHWNGSRWVSFPLGFCDSPEYREWFNDVSGTATDDAWAVGGSRIAHWDGTSWTRMAVPTDTQSLIAVAALSRTQAWAIEMDKVLRWDGTAWSRDTSVPLVAWTRLSAALATGGTLYVTGTNAAGGVLLRYRDGQWSTATLAGAVFNALCAEGPDTVYIVGDKGRVALWDGTTLRDMVGNIDSRLDGCWARCGEGMWLFGDDILRSAQ